MARSAGDVPRQDGRRVWWFRWHAVRVMYQDKTVVVSVDRHVERMTLEHNSWRFPLAPSILFGGARPVLDRRRGCCGRAAWNTTDGSASRGIRDDT